MRPFHPSLLLFPALALLSAPAAAQSQVDDRVPIRGLGARALFEQATTKLFSRIGGAKPTDWDKAFGAARMAVLSELMTAELRVQGVEGADLSVAFPHSDRELDAPNDLTQCLLVPVRSTVLPSFDRADYTRALRGARNLVEKAAKSGSLDLQSQPVVEFLQHIETIRAALGAPQQAQRAVLAYRSWLMQGLLRPAEATAGANAGTAPTVAAATPAPAGPMEATAPVQRAPAPLPLPEIDHAYWGRSQELRDALVDRANHLWLYRGDPITSSYLGTLATVVGYHDTLDAQKAALLERLASMRETMKEAEFQGQRQRIAHWQSMIRAAELELADLDRRTGLVLAHSLVTWRPAVSLVPMTVFFSDAEHTPREKIVAKLVETRRALVAVQKKGTQNLFGQDVPLSDAHGREVRELQEQVERMLHLLNSGDTEGAQRLLEAQCARILGSFDGFIRPPSDSALVDLPAPPDPDSVYGMGTEVHRLQTLAQQARQDRRIATALRTEAHAEWLQALANRSSAQSQAAQLREHFAKAGIQTEADKHAKELARLADRRRVTIGKLLRSSSSLAMFSGDYLHGQAITGLPERVRQLANNIRNAANDAAQASERRECAALADECDRIAALLRQGDVAGAQAAMDAQWALVLGKQPAAGSATAGNEPSFVVPEVWLAAAQQGRTNLQSRVRQMCLGALREVSLGLQSRRDTNGNVPLAALRAFAARSQSPLLVFLADVEDPQLAGRCRGSLAALTQKDLAQAERAGLAPFVADLQQVQQALERRDPATAQRHLDAGWRRVTEVLATIYLPPNEAELAAPAFALDQRLLDPSYRARLETPLRDLPRDAEAAGRQSLQQLAARIDKLGLLGQIANHRAQAEPLQRSLQKDLDERARLQRFGLPVPGQLQHSIEVSEQRLAAIEAAPVPRSLFVQGVHLGTPMPKAYLLTAPLLRNGEWFLRNSRDPETAGALDARIRRIVNAIAPPAHAKAQQQPPLSALHRQELEDGLQRYRKLLDLIESERFDEAQGELDRMSQAILAIEP